MLYLSLRRVDRERASHVDPIQLPLSSFAEREAELTLREADISLRVGDVERRELAVQRAEDALAAQRDRLDAVRAEYESRRDALVARGRELGLERDRLRDDRAQLVAQTMEVEQRERAVASAAAAALVEHPLPAPPAPVDPTDENGDWWTKQLNGTMAATL
jgi:chromosome segregation ATPase